jgi:hypothetical protein
MRDRAETVEEVERIMRAALPTPYDEFFPAHSLNVDGVRDVALNFAGASAQGRYPDLSARRQRVIVQHVAQVFLAAFELGIRVHEETVEEGTLP